jgi:putative transposase
MTESCRLLWNSALAYRKQRWEDNRSNTSYYEQCRVQTKERQVNPLLRELPAQSGQQVLKRLDRAFRAYAHKAGCPKFKKYRESGSFTYPQEYNGSVKTDPHGRRVYLSKVGTVPGVFHRPTPADSMLKICTIVREPCGEWYACLVYDSVMFAGMGPPDELRSGVPKPSELGIDLGLNALITTSDGMEISHPKHLKKAEKRLKRLQKRLSRKKNGSNNYRKARLILAAWHAKVRRRRSDFNHKLSNELAREHHFIAFEDLRIGNMVRNHAFAKSIFDAGWNELVRFTNYKSARVGGLVVKVDPTHSTQECFFCGTLNRVSLKSRQFVCAGCRRVLRRDLNSARIVLKRAIVQVGQDRAPSALRLGDESHHPIVPELKPVETGPLLASKGGCASRVAEAGTTRLEKEAESPRRLVAGGCHNKLTDMEYSYFTTKPEEVGRGTE